MTQRVVVSARRKEWRKVETVGQLPGERDAVTHHLVVNVKALVEPGPHADVLRAASGKQECDAGRRVGCLTLLVAAPVGLSQLRRCARGIGDREYAAVRHGASAGGKCERDVGEVRVGVRFEEVGEAGYRIVDGFRRATRQREYLLGRRRGCGRVLRCLLDDDVSVRTAYAERADPRTTRGRAGGRPRRSMARQHEGRALDVEQRARRGVVGNRWQRLVTQRLNNLDDAGDTGRGIEVTDIRLGGHEAAEPGVGRGRAEPFGKGRDLDRIADGCAGAVRLEQRDVTCRQPGNRERFFDDVGVAVDTRREIAHLATAVVVDGAALHDREDGITVTVGVGQASQRDGAGAAGKHRAAGTGVERTAHPVGREDLAFVVAVAAGVGHFDGDAAGDGHVALERQQALCG